MLYNSCRSVYEYAYINFMCVCVFLFFAIPLILHVVIIQVYRCEYI